MQYGISRTVSLSYEQAIEKITEELKKEGFGILTTIDIQETLKKKIGAEIPRYVILGACNPRFAHAAIQAEQEIGLFLPCNVIVYEQADKVHVAAFNPQVMGVLVHNAALAPLEQDVRERLQRAINAMDSL